MSPEIKCAEGIFKQLDEDKVECLLRCAKSLEEDPCLCKTCRASQECNIVKNKD